MTWNYSIVDNDTIQINADVDLAENSGIDDTYVAINKRGSS